MVRAQFQSRMDNTRATVRREVNLVRGVVEDVVERFDAGGQTEPRHTRGGWPLTRGTLLKTPLWFAGKTMENAVEHVQGFARINRRVINR